MSGENTIEDQFKKFLDDNKIDVSALEGTKAKDQLFNDAKEQRTLGILKAVNTFIVTTIRDSIAIPTRAMTSTVKSRTSSVTLVKHSTPTVSKFAPPRHPSYLSSQCRKVSASETA